jgi:hypothetical protein
MRWAVAAAPSLRYVSAELWPPTHAVKEDHDMSSPARTLIRKPRPAIGPTSAREPALPAALQVVRVVLHLRGDDYDVLEWYARRAACPGDRAPCYPGGVAHLLEVFAMDLKEQICTDVHGGRLLATSDLAQ